MDEIEIPEDLSALSDEQLTELLDNAVAAFDAVYDSDDKSALKDLGEAVLRVRGESDRRAVEAADAAAVAEELRKQIHPEPVAEAESEPVAEADAEPDAEAAPVAETEEVPELVTASRTFHVPAARVREVAPAPATPDDPESLVVITAAANVPGASIGARFGSVEAVAEAMHGVARSLPVSRGNGQMAPVASIDIPVRDGLEITDATSTSEAMDIIRESVNPEILTASGGWCAPSEPIYELFSIEDVDGLVDLPGPRVTRGGVMYPVSPSLNDVFGDAGEPWHWTEAQDLLADDDPPGATKPCFKIPCPSFEEERLACDGMCITHGNLSDMAYPELTRRWLDLFLAAHLHLMSERRITAIIAGSAAVATNDFAGTAAPILSAVDLAVQNYRDLFRMGDSSIVEMLLPRHVRAKIRSDLAFRQGVDLVSVTDAQIAQWFADRGVFPQFLSDFDPLSPGLALQWPATTRFVIYAAGTWALGRGNSIDLGVVRDSTLNATNDHTAAWSEECSVLYMPGHLSRVYTVDTCVNGETNPGTAFDCEPPQPV